MEIDNVTAEVALEWMEKYKTSASGASLTDLPTELKKLQERAGITQTGVLDEATKKLIIIPRCGVFESADSPQEYGEAKREKRFTLQGSVWNKKNLKFRFLSSTQDLPEREQRDVIRKMLRKWEEASTLSLREADPSLSDDQVEILISFVRKYHGDPYRFDGQGGTLAHAYYPHNNRGLSGDAHFDDDEFFTTGRPDGINLDWVALHEFGHSLGLEHSNVRESVMYPWYKGFFENIELTNDDIRGIQALYGKPTKKPSTTTVATTTEPPTTTPKATTKTTTTETPTTTPKETTEASTTETPTTTPKPATTGISTTTPKETTKLSTETPTTTVISTKQPTKATPTPSIVAILDICQIKTFDAFVMGFDRKTYVFSGNYFWVLGVRLGVESGPTLISSKWKELNTPIDSAYTNWNGRIVFFKGNRYWKYSDFRLESGPTTISDLGLPADLNKLDAAFIWEGNHKTYFFNGKNYWRYNEYRGTVDPGYPRGISVWGLPFSINSAMSWIGNRKTYFFKNEQYWRLLDDSLKLENGYPRLITPIWMKCTTV